jgi:hypothetical protein
MATRNFVFEKQFYFPATTIKLRHRQSRQLKVVGYESQRTLLLIIEKFDAKAYFLPIFLLY